MSENEKNLKKEKTVKKLLFGIAKNIKPGGRLNQDDIDRVKKQSLPTTVEEALADGWTMSNGAGMSDPPVLRFTKDGESISIRGEKSGKMPGLLSPLKRKTGGVIKRRGGGIAKRGFGISK